MGQFGHAWSISPDRQRLVAAAGVRREGEPTAVRFVDLASRRVEGTVTLPGEFGRVTATAWNRGRVLVVVSRRVRPGCTQSTRTAACRSPSLSFPALSCSASGRRARPRRCSPHLTESAPPPSLSSIRRPRVRTVVLEKIAVGTTTSGDGAERRLTIRRPALTLGPSGQRAFVIGAGEPPAAVDLRTLSVRYAPVRLPAAANKQVEGSIRTADTLPDGRIVVGANVYGATAAENTAGLCSSTPRDWSRRVLSPKWSWFRVDGGLIFARGESGVGLRIIQPSGATREPSAPDPSPASPSSGRERSSPSSARTSKRPSSSRHRPRCQTPRPRLPTGRRRTADHRLNHLW